MQSIWNNPTPAHADFKINTVPAYGMPVPANAPNPNWQKSPGYTPPLPQRAVPAPSQAGNLLLNVLPSILSMTIK